MKILRHLLFAPFLVATLVAGLLAVRTAVQNRTEPISLCEVLANKYLYSGLDLNISARLTGRTVHDLGCGGEYGEWADVDFAEQPEFNNLHSGLDRLNTATEFAYSDVVLSGSFRYVGVNCVSLDSSITNARIVSSGPIQVNKIQ